MGGWRGAQAGKIRATLLIIPNINAIVVFIFGCFCFTYIIPQLWATLRNKYSLALYAKAQSPPC